jgi:ribosomal protein L7/L12
MDELLIKLLTSAHEEIGQLKSKLEACTASRDHEDDAVVRENESLYLQADNLRKDLARIQLSDLESIMSLSGNKVHAIRLYRAISGDSLKKSKEYIETSNYFTKWGNQNG